MVSDEDRSATEGVGFGADDFLGRGDEGRDEDAPAHGGVEPELTAAFAFLRSVATMDNHCLFEGIVKQMEIAIGLIADASDIEATDTPEEIGPAAAHSKPVRILANVAEETIQGAGRFLNLVIKSIVKHAIHPGCFIDCNFEAGYNTAENFLRRIGDEQKNMDMIRHQGVLHYFNVWLNPVEIS